MDTTLRGLVFHCWLTTETFSTRETDMSKQEHANAAIGVLTDTSDFLKEVKVFIDSTDDADLKAAAKQATDAVTLLRMKLWNRSCEGKFR